MSISFYVYRPLELDKEYYEEFYEKLEYMSKIVKQNLSERLDDFNLQQKMENDSSDKDSENRYFTFFNPSNLDDDLENAMLILLLFKGVFGSKVKVKTPDIDMFEFQRIILKYHLGSELNISKMTMRVREEDSCLQTCGIGRVSVRMGTGSSGRFWR